jgi:disease resistance protein RPM1
MAEAIGISLSEKLSEALYSSAALRISHLFCVRSDIAAAQRELDLLRAFLRFADSRRGTAADHVAAMWLRQLRQVAFELEDAADVCSYLSRNGGLARAFINITTWLALSRRLRKALETLRRLSAAKEQYNIVCPGDGAGDPSPSVAIPNSTRAENAHFLEKEEIVGLAAHEKQLIEWVVEDKEPRRTVVAVCGMGGVLVENRARRVDADITAPGFSPSLRLLTRGHYFY